MTNNIQLTKYLDVANGSHMVYFFEDKSRYLDNMMAYIKSGLKRQHHLLIIENSMSLKESKKRIKKLFSKEEQKMIHYIDSHDFYHKHNSVFQMEKTLQQFVDLYDMFKKNNIDAIRTWSYHECSENETLCDILSEYEKIADSCISKMGIMSVCAYSSSAFSASFQTTLMRSHEYLMTDNEFVRSTLYKSYDLID